MEILQLASDLARAAACLAKACYRDELLCVSEEEIFDNLQRAERYEENFSLALVDEHDHLRGYLMAWIQTSLVRQSTEAVLWLDDCCLDRGARRNFASLIQTMVERLEATDKGRLPIETVVTPEGLDLAADHDDVFEDLGYALVASHQYEDEASGITMTWLRYQLET